ncbi:MAG: DUF2069 domain-containing protein [Burkholderiaceae bacterium]|jgi:uncharacterized membrane protein
MSNACERRQALRWTATASTLALIVLCTGWELWWAPLRPGGSWLVLKVLPLLLMLPGLSKGRVYTYQWTSMAILLYLAEGGARVVSDAGNLSGHFAWAELLLAGLIFAAVLLYCHSHKTGTPLDRSDSSLDSTKP